MDSGCVVDAAVWLLLYEVENPEPPVNKLRKLLVKPRDDDCTGDVVIAVLDSWLVEDRMALEP